MIKRLYQQCLDWMESPAAMERDRLAFLPAALEVQETPPSPLGRGIILSIILLFVIAVIWAAVGKIDIVAVATGKVIPSDRVKIIQPMEKSTVLGIHVREDTAVRKGDLLVTLDGTQTRADVVKLEDSLNTARDQWLRALALELLMKTPDAESVEVLELAAASIGLQMREADAELQTRLVAVQWQEFQSRVRSLQAQQRAREGEREQARSMAQRFEKTLPMITERTQSVESLYQKKMASREQFLALEEERITQQQSLLAEQARVAELTGEVEALENQVDVARAEQARDNLRELIEARNQSITLEQEWVKARQRDRQQVLVAPIDGVVKQLAIHTIGGVVTPAQELMQIVPVDTVLEVEAFFQNKDIGFVTEGQVAEVKVDTFNFTKYGTIDAELKTISNDAITDEKLGLVYPATVLIKSNQVKVAGKWVKLAPGMSVTVEVKTGKRRIIEFFMSPLLRYKQESIRER